MIEMSCFFPKAKEIKSEIALKRYKLPFRDQNYKAVVIKQVKN